MNYENYSWVFKDRSIGFASIFTFILYVYAWGETSLHNTKTHNHRGAWKILYFAVDGRRIQKIYHHIYCARFCRQKRISRPLRYARVAGIELKFAVALVNCSLCYFLFFIIGQTMEKLVEGVLVAHFTNASNISPMIRRQSDNSWT